MRSVVDRNVVMRRISVHESKTYTHFLANNFDTNCSQILKVNADIVGSASRLNT